MSQAFLSVSRWSGRSCAYTSFPFERSVLWRWGEADCLIVAGGQRGGILAFVV